MIASQEVPVIVGTATVSEFPCPDFLPTNDERDLNLLPQHLLQLRLQGFPLRASRNITIDRFIEWFWDLDRGISHDLPLSVTHFS
jgi:hypothetical protein